MIVTNSYKTCCGKYSGVLAVCRQDVFFIASGRRKLKWSHSHIIVFVQTGLAFEHHIEGYEHPYEGCSVSSSMLVTTPYQHPLVINIKKNTERQNHRWTLLLKKTTFMADVARQEIFFREKIFALKNVLQKAFRFFIPLRTAGVNSPDMREGTTLTELGLY